jgi:hypothetical protein
MTVAADFLKKKKEDVSCEMESGDLKAAPKWLKEATRVMLLSCPSEVKNTAIDNIKDYDQQAFSLQMSWPLKMYHFL